MSQEKDKDRRPSSKSGGRSRERDRDRRRKRSKSKSRSRSSRRSKKSSRSRSRGREKKKKKTSMWDQGPGSMPGLLAASIPTPGARESQLNQARQARRLYVGNIPLPLDEETLRRFFAESMARAHPDAAPGEVVISAYINVEKKFGFVEFRSTEEATLGMQLDGISFRGIQLKVRRPSDYNPSLFPTNFGMPNMDIARLGVVSTQVQDTPNKVFCGGLPYNLGENEVKELVGAFGPLKAFHLVRDKDSALSKGYCFFEYVDPNVTDVAIEGLNGIEIGTKTLTIRRAQQRAGAPALPMMPMPIPGLAPLAAPLMLLQQQLGANRAGQIPTRVLVMMQMVVPEDLVDDKEYKEILEDIELECGKYGLVKAVVVPRPLAPLHVPGLGKVFVEFDSVGSAMKAKSELEGRKFANRTVLCEYMPEDQFAKRELD